MRREHRHELQSDELISGLGAVIHWGRTNARAVGWGAVAVVGLAALVGGLLTMRANRKDALRTELTALVGNVESEAGVCVEALPRLLEIGESEGSSVEGRTASYFAGVCRKEAGDWAGAAQSFDRARGRPDLLSALATYGFAQARRGEGAVEDAADALRSLLGGDDGFPVDAALYELATLEEERGASDEALRLYERLESEHADSRYRPLAESRVARLAEPAR